MIKEYYIPPDHIHLLQNLALELPPYPIKTAADFEAKGIGKGKIGVYFLWNQQKDLVYVGRSLDIHGRIISHDKIKYAENSKCWVHSKRKYEVFVSYLEIDEKELNWIELLYIGILRPKLNGEAKSKRRKNDS